MGKYINLMSGSIPEADGTGVKFSLDSQVVRMGGKNWGWIWNRPRGIIIGTGKRSRRVPIIDFTRLVQAIIYGVSVLLVTIGLIKKVARNGGELNGG